MKKIIEFIWNIALYIMAVLMFIAIVYFFGVELNLW